MLMRTESPEERRRVSQSENLPIGGFAKPDSGVETERRGWVPTSAGAHLRGRRTEDTAPELILRRAVHALGFRFRLRRRLAGCRPDFVMPRHRVAVFVDGCFWHNCPQHGPKEFRGRTLIVGEPNYGPMSSETVATTKR